MADNDNDDVEEHQHYESNFDMETGIPIPRSPLCGRGIPVENFVFSKKLRPSQEKATDPEEWAVTEDETKIFQRRLPYWGAAVDEEAWPNAGEKVVCEMQVDVLEDFGLCALIGALTTHPQHSLTAIHDGEDVSGNCTNRSAAEQIIFNGIKLYPVERAQRAPIQDPEALSPVLVEAWRECGNERMTPQGEKKVLPATIQVVLDYTGEHTCGNTERGVLWVSGIRAEKPTLVAHNLPPGWAPAGWTCWGYVKLLKAEKFSSFVKLKSARKV